MSIRARKGLAFIAMTHGQLVRASGKVKFFMNFFEIFAFFLVEKIWARVGREKFTNEKSLINKGV